MPPDACALAIGWRVARGAAARKLLRIVYIMLRRGEQPSPGSQVIESERRTARMPLVAETEVKEEQDAPLLQPNTGEREFTLLTPVAS